MATTGADIYRIWQAEIFKSYSSFYNTTKVNDLFKKALYLYITDSYENLGERGDYDALMSVIRTDQVFGLNNNKIFTAPIPILSIGAGLTPTITTTVDHNLTTGDSVTFEDVAAITTTPIINGFSFTVTILSSTTFSIILTSNIGTHTANTGGISVISQSGITKIISDYGDLLMLKAKYNHTLDLQVTNATNAQPIRITVNKRNNIKTTEKINISGINGNTNANGTYYLKKINTYQYDLYEDKDLLNPVGGNGIFGGIGKIIRPYYKVCTPSLSSKKISVYNEPTISNPQFEGADTQLKILPSDSVCSEITCDYIRYDLVLIDAANTAIDLELTYPFDFLMEVVDRAALIFYERTKDLEGVQIAVQAPQQ